MIQFSLLTPEGELFAGQVDQVTAQGVEGELGILPDHVPLVTPLKVAPLSVKVQGEERRFAVYGGLLQVTPKWVTVLVEEAHRPDQIDPRQVQVQQEALQGRLSRAQEPAERDALQAQLERLAVQLEVAG